VLDLSVRTLAATSRAGPHAVLSGLAQRAASAAIGTVRQLAGGAEFSKNGFMGQGTDSNIKWCSVVD
jgi:hypothetical protein